MRDVPRQAANVDILAATRHAIVLLLFRWRAQTSISGTYVAYAVHVWMHDFLGNTKVHSTHRYSRGACFSRVTTRCRLVSVLPRARVSRGVMCYTIVLYYISYMYIYGVRYDFPIQHAPRANSRTHQQQNASSLRQLVHLRWIFSGARHPRARLLNVLWLLRLR